MRNGVISRCVDALPQCLLLWCLLLFELSSMYSVKVKIVNEANVTHNVNYNALKSSKGQPSNYSGPEELRYLFGRCFTYWADKYEYRVCPFQNVTQHERTVSAGTAYNGIIGLWKEWSVRNNSFQSLMYYFGDDCGKGMERSARMDWVCDRHSADRVLDIREPKRCFYEIQFASEFGCENHYRYIYSHLSVGAKRKWDQIETDLFYKELTPFGYDWAVRQLLIAEGIVQNRTQSVDTVTEDDSFDTKEQCFDKFISLKKQNLELIKRIEVLEKQLNFNKTIL